MEPVHAGKGKNQKPASGPAREACLNGVQTTTVQAEQQPSSWVAQVQNQEEPHGPV